MVVALDIPTLGSVAAFAAIAACVAWAELALRRASRSPIRFLPAPSRRQPAMTARRAQALYERVLFVIAPAVVAAAIALSRDVPKVVALVLLACILATSAGLWPRHTPVRLMPVARFGLRFALPAIGICVALVPGLFDPWEFTPATAVPSLVGAWLIVGLGIWLERSFDADRPIRLAVIGSRELAAKLAAEMRQLRVRDYVVVGFIGVDEPPPEPDEEATDVLPWLGEIDEVREVVQLIGIDLLAVGPDSPRLQVFETTANACLDLPVRMLEASAFYEEVLGHVPIGQINSAWFQCIMHPRYSPTSPLSKRMLDLAVALPLALLIALPLVPLLALLVKLSDGGPAFFRQRRVGEQGREFDIVKLRTMRPDAAELAGLVPRDQLITPLGRVLRRSHFDELPQLWNVIRGDMTLVGPRPEQPALVEELARVVPYYQRRSLVKPGVTGWAQVRCGYAGSQVGTAWKICHDLYYVKRRSIVFDVLILVQTLHIMSERNDQELVAPADDFILGEAASLVSR
jgi:lipopolysaccharide/colanic/teichoic acid biosynthesis glycosyltransferase